MRAAMLAAFFLLVVPTVAADHPGSNLGLARYVGLEIPGPLGENVVHRLPDIADKFAAWELAYPQWVARQTIGATSTGWQLLTVTITDEETESPLSSGEKVRVYLDGGHHGNEYLGVELLMYYLEEVLAKASAGDEATLAFLRETEIHALPILNVDGNFADTRKNARQVDLNRNYDFAWGAGGFSSSLPFDPTYRGPSAFSERETRDNAAHVLEYSPDLWISMHTGIAALFWNAGEPFLPDAPDIGLFLAIEKPFEAATNGRIDAYGGPAPADGSADDYGYAVAGTVTLTYEVHEDQNLPVYGEPIPDVLADQLAGLRFLVENARRLGAWVELEPATPGASEWVARNHGWGIARNVTITFASGGEAHVLPDIMPGEAFHLSFVPAVGDAWEYPVLLVEASRVRTHVLSASDAIGPAAGDTLPIPGFGAAALCLVGLASRMLRRTGRACAA